MLPLARALTCCAMAAALAFTALPSRAQVPLMPTVRIKAGVYMPSDSGLQNATSDTWPRVGIDVTIPVVGLRAGAAIAFDGSNTLIPLTLTKVFQPSLVVTQSPVYGGIGIGLYNAKAPGGSGSTLGLHLMGGVEFGGWLLEANYDIAGKISGQRIDGLSILIGRKF